MNKINVITPPDKLFNLNVSYLLIKPSINIKIQFQNVLSKFSQDLNVFVFDQDETNIEWMLSVCQQVDIIIIDIDNCDHITKSFISFVIAQPNAFYFTLDESTPWGLISKNRIYNLDWINDNLKEDEDESEN
ncbi:hypothetical protein EB118_09420 [bacterium]|nr:hypothetical protein [bacterium]